MPTATEVNQTSREADLDERVMHERMQWFTEKWTVALDLNKRDAAEFGADLLLLVQAIHRDSSRVTHALLTKALMAMPPAPIFVAKKE